MFARLASFVTTHWLAVLIGWPAILLVVYLLAPDWNSLVEDGESAYLPAHMSSVRGAALIKKAFPKAGSKSQAVVVAARSGAALSNADFAAVDRLVESLQPENDAKSPVVSVLSHVTPLVGPELTSPVSRNGQATLILLNLRTEMAAVENMGFIRRLQQKLAAAERESEFPAGLELAITGASAINANVYLAAEQSLRNTEWTTIVLVVLILAAVYRAWGLVVVPLLCIFAAWLLSIDLLSVAADLSRRTEWFDFKIFRTSKIFIVVMLFGAATDYCLFLIARYMEGLRDRLPPDRALHSAVANVGSAITASALATILGLCSLLFAEFGRYRYGGPTIAFSLLVALAACLTLAPAVLRAGGRALFWPLGLAAPAADEKSRLPALDRLWDRLSRVVVNRAGWVFLLCLAAMAWPAYLGLSVPVTYDLLSELNRDEFSVHGTKLLTHYFPPGQTGPITLLAWRDDPVFQTEEGRADVSRLTRELETFVYQDSAGRRIRPLVSVRSLTNPLGGAAGVLNPFTALGRRNLEALHNPQIVAAYLSKAPGYEGKAVRFDLISAYDPFSPESVRLLDALERRMSKIARDPNSGWLGTQFAFVGTTAEIRDLAAVNHTDFLRVAVLTSGVVLVVLVFLLRRFLVSVFLILTMVGSYLATMGVTKLVFTALYGSEFEGVTWRLPLFLFVILIAVGEDYNIYLMSRVVEEQKRLGTLEGLRVALVRTGGIITSCGIIMAGTFASMMTGTLREMHELGFALSFGVLLDTIVIRTILVPSFLALIIRGTQRMRVGGSQLVQPPGDD